MSLEEKEENIEEKDFVGLTEASKILGVHRNSLYQWVTRDWKNKNNKLSTTKFLCPPYTRIGSRYRFKREDIEKFIQDPLKH
jgi:predicted DNA-binding transcriptional regulator AlpA